MTTVQGFVPSKPNADEYATALAKQVQQVTEMKVAEAIGGQYEGLNADLHGFVEYVRATSPNLSMVQTYALAGEMLVADIVVQQEKNGFSIGL